ncbi:uncharacterized protein [Spinacia oleracea]|uniref:Uncharacterized protein isoform X3 n=1 Tax=Spinacia oleracea TaxID=3562 RepID=A0ABM3RE74_SPIOL|nr:uncharacterized protein LOC110793159 isoform X3 [Spinacia oleracea]
MGRGGGGRGGGGGSRGGGGGFFSKGTSSSKSSKSAAKAPTPATTPAPAPVPAAKDSTTGLGAAVADGFGWGFGSSMGRRISDFVMGPRESVAYEAPTVYAQSENTLGGSDVCYDSMKTFKDCLNSNVNDISKCQFYMDMLYKCRGNSDSAAL